MNFSDAQLADAVEFLWHQYCENLPDVSDYHPAYSADFLKKMDRMCAEYSFKRKVKSFIQNVAVVVLLVIIIGSACLVTSPTARALVRTWIVELFEDTFVYHFFENDIQSEWRDYEITELPEGYLKIHADTVAGVCTQLYQHEGDILAFVYHKIDEGTVHAIKDKERESTYVGRIAADYYSSGDGTANTLVWIDEDAQVMFSLSGFFEQKTLVKIAESIQNTK